MDSEFWKAKWEKNEIGFHLKKVHPLLKKNIKQLLPDQKKVIFVPLCGKTLDIAFLLSEGYQVVASELSEVAIQQLFSDLKMTPNVTDWKAGKCYQIDDLTVWVGDFFALDNEQLGQVDLIYDRAALIALTPQQRQQYSSKISGLTQQAMQLLITLEYDQNLMSGPPFSVDKREVDSLYGERYQIEQIQCNDIIEHEPKFASRGLKQFFECLYIMRKTS